MKSINGKVTLFMGAILALVMFAGLVNVWISYAQISKVNAIVNASGLLRNHMEADMLHDSIRGDVVTILVKARNADPDLTADIERLSRNNKLLMEKLQLDLSYQGDRTVRDAAATVDAPLAAYTGKALAIAEQARSNPETATAMLPEFQSAFEELEGSMASISDAIEKHVAAVGTSSASYLRLALFASAAGMVLTTLAIIGVAIACRRHLVAPLVSLIHAIGRLARGEAGVTLPCQEREDELGDLVRATQDFRNQLDAADRSKAEQTHMLVSSIGEGLSALASGDLSREVNAQLSPPFSQLKDDFNSAVAALRAVMGEVVAGAESIRIGVGEIRSASDDLAHRTETQASQVEEAASQLGEVTEGLARTAHAAATANESVSLVREDATQSGDVVRRAIGAMDGIARQSEEIAEIIGMIDGIAFQTNLLALNAGVEAARAGDAGKGFAVVASEVRALAQRTTDAANQVKSRVTSAGEQIATGVSLVGETGTVLERITARIEEIGELVQSIAVSSDGQSNSLQQINKAVGGMDRSTQQNAAMVEQANAATRSLGQETQKLAAIVAKFKLGHTADSNRPIVMRAA
ncbi:methyl-accepting chemotaxis protein [Novosphingobium mathurense]|uniref:Methyl-accepting chemotaxis protein n=2 Tax=Novosphingobium mathurense TaxID=428990 RepID=A0A1U6IC21_9SPHN|nr:methyl-accepting chemotaxis protein [Novosphingobium mathurense]